MIARFGMILGLALVGALVQVGWRPVAAASDSWLTATTSWQIQLDGAIDTSIAVDAYDIDLFEAPQATIDKLHAQGRKVICYFSAGSYENWRPDKRKFKKSDLGLPLDGWPGERWLNIRSANVKKIMTARMQLAVTKKCDAVDPDNVDGYANKNGRKLTAQDQLTYNKFLADTAHSLGLPVGLKNDVEQIPKLVGSFDFTVNEECFKYNECDALKPFTDAGKPVFQIEYGKASKANTICPQANQLGFQTLIKRLDLKAWRVDCHNR